MLENTEMVGQRRKKHPLLTAKLQRKTLAVLLALSLLFSSFGSIGLAAEGDDGFVYQTGNVIQNGSFEDVNPDDSTDAIGWEQAGSASSTAFHTGSGSRSLQLKSSTGEELISAAQDINVVAEETYNFWFRAYDGLAGGDNRTSEVILSYFDANGAQVGDDQILASFDSVNTAGVWGKTEKPVTIPTGVETARIYIYADHFTGDYFYDLMTLDGAIEPSGVPLTAPTNVTAEAVSYEAVDVSWSASDGDAWGYKVFRDGIEVGDVTGTSFSDTGLTGSTEYSYTVEAYSPNEPSQVSDAVTVTTLEAPAEPTLTAPTNVSAAAASHDTVDVSWTAADGDVVGYKILRDGSEVGDVTGTTFTDTGLFELTEYSYVVTAYNADWSMASDAVTVTTTQGPVQYETGELLINGSFEEVNPDDATDAIGWEQNGAVVSEIYNTGSGSKSLRLNSSDPGTLVSATQDVGVVAGKSYDIWFRTYIGEASGENRISEVLVSYIDSNGNPVGEDQVISSFNADSSHGVWGRIDASVTVPQGADQARFHVYADNFTGHYFYDLFSFTGAIPAELTAPTDVAVESFTHKGAKLSWSPSQGAVDGYKILRDGVEVGDVNITSFEDSGLAASTEYSYVVEAYNAGGSAASDAVSVTTASAPVVNGELLQNSNFEEFDAVTLKPLHWEATDGVESTDDYRRHGTRSLRFGFGGDTELRLSAEQTVSAFSQHIYKLRSFFHDPNGVGESNYPDRVSEIVIHYLDAAGEKMSSDVLVRYDKNTTDTAVYKENIREFTTPEGAAAFTVELYGEGFGNFFLYDWFQMSLVGPAPDAPQPPDAPSKVVGIVTSETEVELSWTEVTSGNVNSYKVYRDGVEIAEVTENSYIDSGLTPDTEYSYTVTSINDVGESEQSAATVVTTTFVNDVTPPDRPVLRADAESSTKIVLRWKGVHDDIRVADHEIYRNGDLIADTGVLMGDYTDDGLTPGTTYNYEVIAVDPSGNRSEISNTAYATTFDGSVNQYVEGLVQLNYYINEANADLIYRMGPGYAGETGLTARAVVDLPDGAEEFTAAITDTTKTVISVPISGLPVGQYTVALSITDSSGNTIWATEDDILKNPAAPANTRVTQVDHDREIMLVDGAPYYPIGVFGADSDSMQQLADAGFNTTLRWKGYTTWPSYDMELEPDDPSNVEAISTWLDAVDDAGMYAFESPVKMAEEKYYHNYKDPNWDEKYPIHNEIITPGVLQTAATHPAVIGYYSYDEVDNFYECCPTYSDHVVMQHGVEEWYDVVKGLDPYHSVMTLFAVGISKNSDWNAWDIVARDYYYADSKHMSDVFKVMKQSANTAREWNDPFIATPLFEEWSYQRKPLNGIEQRASTYSSIIAGARGVYYWDWAAVYNDNWDMLKQVAGEMNELTPILTERIPLQSIVYADGTKQNTNTSSTGMNQNAQALVTNHDGKTYLLTVNTENAPIEVTFNLPAEHSGTGTVWFEGREIEVVDGTFTDTFEPYARHVYELQGTWVEGNEIELDVEITGDHTVYVDPEFASQSKNMILNNSFEYSYGSAPGIPSNWFNGDSIMNSGQTGPDGEWHVDDDESYHGDASMRLTEKEGGIYDDIFLFQVPGIFQGGLSYNQAGTYTYSTWMKADREDVTVVLQEGWTTFEYVEVGTEWARYEVQIEKSGAGGGFAALYVLGQGTVWVDAMQMELANTATDFEATVLTNPDQYTGSVTSKPLVAAPTDLTAEAVSNNTIELSWIASETEGVEYEISRNGDAITTTSATSYTDSGLERATEYTYSVIAVDAEGDVSGAVETSVTTLDQPSAPTNLQAEVVSPTQVNLSWTASENEVIGYIIFRDGVGIGLSETTAYTSKGLTPETEYVYTVKAVEVSGKLSNSSNEAVVTTLTPSIQNVSDLVSDYAEAAEISSVVESQLANKLNQAQKHLDKGSVDQAVKFLEDALQTLNNNGLQKDISDAAKLELEAQINLLMDHLING